MRYLIKILLALVFAACSKDEYDYIAREGVFTNSSNTIDIISQDSLVWKLSVYRDEPKEYRIKYNQLGDEINFEVKDTVRVDYIDSVFGESFVVNYYSDSFSGKFISPNAIEGDAHHSCVELSEDKYIFSTSAADLYLTYRR